MRVPIRKPGKYTHDQPDLNVTENKFQELCDKLKKLQASQPAAAAEVRRTAEMGDLSENAGYQIAKGRLRGINEKILQLQDQINRAKIIQPGNTGTVNLGATVTVEIAGKQKDFLILGSSETDPARGIISHLSPIGQALLGKRAGETARVKLKDREVAYKIIAIR